MHTFMLLIARSPLTSQVLRSVGCKTTDSREIVPVLEGHDA